MPRRKTLYRALLADHASVTHGLGRPLELPPGVPATLEIGMGNGGALIHRARSEPDRIFVGLEIKEERAYQAARAAAAAGLTNMRFMVGELTRVADLMPAARFDDLMILFPDPWPKQRDTDRRLVAPKYLDVVRRWLTPGATGVFRTDHAQLFDYAATTIPAAGFTVVSVARDIPIGEWVTRFEGVFRKNCIAINELRFVWQPASGA